MGGGGEKKAKSLRKQTRDLEKLLRRNNLPEEVRKEKQKLLDELREKATDQGKTEREAEQKAKRKQAKFRQHKIRKAQQSMWIEKTKVTRKIKQSRRRLVSAEPVSETAKNEAKVLEGLQEDLFYIENFPFDDDYPTYIPLIVKKEPEKKRTARESKIKEVKALLRKQFEESLEKTREAFTLDEDRGKPRKSSKKRGQAKKAKAETKTTPSTAVEIKKKAKPVVKEEEADEPATVLKDDFLHFADDEDEPKEETSSADEKDEVESPNEGEKLGLNELLEMDKDGQKKLLSRKERSKLGILKARRKKSKK